MNFINIKKINYGGYNRFKHYNLRIDNATFSDKMVTLEVFCEDDLKIDDVKISDDNIVTLKVLCKNKCNYQCNKNDGFDDSIRFIFIIFIVIGLLYNAYDHNKELMKKYRKKIHINIYLLGSHLLKLIKILFV